MNLRIQKICLLFWYYELELYVALSCCYPEFGTYSFIRLLGTSDRALTIYTRVSGSDQFDALDYPARS